MRDDKLVYTKSTGRKKTSLGFKKDGFDIIISNPPYVSSGEIKTLSPDVRDFEPIESLNGGREGLDLIKKVIIRSPDFLKRRGFLILEIGKDQIAPVLRMINERGVFESISIKKDLAGIERVVMAQKIK